MAEPKLLPGVRASTEAFLAELDALAWTDEQAAAPSRLPGWTRGHVLTHIARNADGISDTLEGALRGEIVERYPGGKEARNAAIEAGASRRYVELVSDVRGSAARLNNTFDDVNAADGWQLPTEHHDPAESWVYRRWREIEIHWVDLDVGYSPESWPALFVTSVLSGEMSTLADRVGGAVRVEVTPNSSKAAELVGEVWTAGEGTPVDVKGPDWAILAWLVGRPETAQDALTATPKLGAWR